MSFETLKIRFFDFIQISFWASRQVQNELRGQCETLKHRFFDLTQVAFCVGQEAENKFKEYATP